MSPDEMIAVIQAHKDGKPIQRRFKANDASVNAFGDCQNPAWDFLHHDYRVKPEPKVPREFWVELLPCFTSDNGATAQAATVHFYHPPQPGAIHVREVLEEQP